LQLVFVRADKEAKASGQKMNQQKIEIDLRNRKSEPILVVE